ncbi:hypothetical protein BH23BAC1_BH23BAC1_42920 [soil metagenome]
MSIIYHITALQMTIYFNKEGDHDHNGLLFVLNENLPILKYIRAILIKAEDNNAEDPDIYYQDAQVRANDIGVTIPLGTNDQRLAMARQPHPLVRPLVLRCNKGDTVTVHLKNEIKERWIGLHLVGDGYDVVSDDGSHVGDNPNSLVMPGGKKTYTFTCQHEGVFPFHDGGNYSGGEDGTNVHGLFGALIVEPENTIWRDPVTGRKSREKKPGTEEFIIVPLMVFIWM